MLLGALFGVSLTGCSLHTAEPVTGSMCYVTESSDPWIVRPPIDDYKEFHRQKISEKNWYEVVPPKLDAALRDLTSEAVVALSCVEARWFAGVHYECTAGHTAYLIRAVYGQGETGGYSLYQFDESLLVQHSSLGSPLYHRAALVVNLPSPPRRVFVDAGFAL